MSLRKATRIGMLLMGALIAGLLVGVVGAKLGQQPFVEWAIEASGPTPTQLEQIKYGRQITRP